MDPITSLAVGHAAGKLIDKVVDSFRVNVIERWSRRRAKHFFEEFCHEIEKEASGEHSEKLEDLLEKMLKDEHASEVLFDAYRRISLSRSKNIGPRVIGILAARVALGGREPTETEESLMDAADQLYDEELVEFASFIHDHRKYVIDKNRSDVTLCNQGALRIKWHSEQIDSNWDREFDVSLAPLKLDESCGSWAAKLESLGIIKTDVTEKKWDYREDSERHIDRNGSVREISWWIITWGAYFELADLIDRVGDHARDTKQQTNARA